MRTIAVLFAVLCLVALACGRPKYIAIPVEDIQFLNLAPVAHRRVARQAPYPYHQLEPDTAASDERPSRQASHHADPHDYVDYGAHTGHHGAFGWYADFPVHAHEH